MSRENRYRREALDSKGSFRDGDTNRYCETGQEENRRIGEENQQVNLQMLREATEGRKPAERMAARLAQLRDMSEWADAKQPTPGNWSARHFCRGTCAHATLRTTPTTTPSTRAFLT